MLALDIALPMSSELVINGWPFSLMITVLALDSGWRVCEMEFFSTLVGAMGVLLCVAIRFTHVHSCSRVYVNIWGSYSSADIRADM